MYMRTIVIHAKLYDTHCYNTLFFSLFTAADLYKENYVQVDWREKIGRLTKNNTNALSYVRTVFMNISVWNLIIKKRFEKY